MPDESLEGIAIIGLTGRFPGAANVDELWQNLTAGVESISTFTDEQLAASGLDVATLKSDSHYVPARGILKDADCFDAAFFGINPKEAEVTDPQQRVFLEACWEALENAGYAPGQFNGSVGVYAGMGNNTYYLNNLHSRPDLAALVGPMVMMMANEKDYLATRVAYKLNLKGPAINVNTACSTSLVAVCQACQSLLNFQCDIALAGAVSITFPQNRGYHYEEGGISSPDGHCRAFDAEAKGTVPAHGLGIVVLKRLAEALKDGDEIYAVIKGASLNNDGSSKVSFTSPSVQGHTEVIAMAQAQAGFDPRTISYVETHGTATPLGDPIEIEGLTRAFGGTDAKNFCAIGSLKSNFGHLDTAAGVASLIKTALALKHKLLPPSLHYTKPNAAIDFANSPFFVNTKLTEWPAGPTPRRAGVSCFGLGGTNAHVVLEEAPARPPSSPSRHAQLLVISARTPLALDAATANLAAHFKTNPHLNLANAAFTLQAGRVAFNHRRMLACWDVADAAAALESLEPKRVFGSHQELENPPVAFMFPGQGAQYINMGAELYRTEATFKDEVDRCTKILQPHLNLDLRQVLFPHADRAETAAQWLVQTRITQPALFVVEYALAKLWMSWGIKPRAMIGHSVGEYVAACLAGVFTLEEALELVAARARLVQSQPSGAMLAVRLPENETLPLLTPGLSLAAVNSHSTCVVSGPHDLIKGLEKQLNEKSIPGIRLQTSHAFHSAMMDPAIAPLTDLVRKINLKPPTIPFVSNVTGQWITVAQATDPDYWSTHLRQTVRFADGVGLLLKDSQNVLLEVGPGRTLSTFTRQHPAKTPGQVVLSSIAPQRDQRDEARDMLETLGKLWLAGVSVDWPAFHANEKRQRIPLPTYPFERKRFWAEPAPTQKPEPTAFPQSAPMDIAPSRPDVLKPTLSRRDQILAILVSQLQQLSGANLADVSPSATFPELGFDSLFLTQASQAFHKRFGVKVTFRQLLEQLPTLNDLAAYLDEHSPADIFPATELNQPARTISPAVVPTSWNAALQTIQQQLESVARQLQELKASVLPSSRETVAASLPVTSPPAENITLPLTEAQMELWLATQMSEQASCALNQTFLLHLHGSLDLPALAQSLQDLVDRHDALRTTFLPGGSGQKIAPALRLEVATPDFSAFAPHDQQEHLSAALRSQDEKPFDLVNGPLVRAQIIKLSATHHTLILATHHLVMDGWSIGVMVREAARLYSARVQGNPAGLETAMQYRDYLQLLNAPEQLAESAAAGEYWLRQYATPPPIVELPADRSRPARKTYCAARASLVLDSALQQSVKQAMAREGCTLFSYLFASFQICLRRLTGQQDLAVGVPAAGQIAIDSHNNTGGKSLVGHCVNLLPIRTRCDEKMLVKDFLKEVKHAVLDAHEHQSFTFGNLLKKLNFPRDPSRLPLISMTFNATRAASGFVFQGLDSELIFPPKSFSIFDLAVDVSDSDHALRIDCQFNTDLFDAATIQRWLGHWKTLLEGMAANPNQSVWRLPILNEAECHSLLVELNNTRADFPRHQCLHQLFEARAKLNPDAVALVFEDQHLSYRELNQRSNQLARYLQTLGVGPETLVALCMERSLNMVIGLLGILKAGGAYLPLDPNHPHERLKLILEDAQAAVLVTQQSVLRDLPSVASKLVSLDSHLNAFKLQEKTDLPCNTEPRKLAYVLYTSGSTGKPKGVQISHHALVNFLTSMSREPGLVASDILLAVTTPSFDIAGLELWLPLIVGARVVIATSETTMNGNRLATQLDQSLATVMQATPATWRMLLDAGWAGNPRLKILCGGEAWPEDLARQLLPRCGSLWNMYGPTETTIWSAVSQVKTPSLPLIGSPVANTQLHVLNSRLRLVPLGVPGELHIGGDGLARGYLNRPTLTAEKFIPDPFSSEPGARLYKTGDLVRRRSDGNIEFLSRMDHQVKIRGFRIELGEIEGTLRQHPHIGDAAVAAIQRDQDGPFLAAYIVPRRAAPPGAGELRAFLKERLPDYMIPSAFVVLDALPLTPNGKVDKNALRKPDVSSAPEEFVPPGTELEKALAEIWCEVLKLKQVGLHEDFFELGGHSLIAMQLIARLDNYHDLQLSLRDLFDSPTIYSMARLLESRESEHNSAAAS
ncbi:MAG: Malonyl CoA-acyl carrier protein transacylase [Pedosphaera sp.]|nr:Malonyl CoA-acyl carrier protein transacylase [Pedosphaera sp.]